MIVLVVVRHHHRRGCVSLGPRIHPVCRHYRSFDGGDDDGGDEESCFVTKFRKGRDCDRDAASHLALWRTPLWRGDGVVVGGRRGGREGRPAGGCAADER